MITDQNQTVPKPTLKDLLDLHKKDIFLNLNCHAIGTIQSFDPATLTAKVTINYKKTYLSSGDAAPTYVEYPILTDCPVVILSGGLSQLTFPIAIGDECLVIFNDRDIDNWHSSGQIGPVDTIRMHSMSDAIALVGVRSVLKPIIPYDNIRASLSYGTTTVGVGPALVKIANATTTLNTLLQTLIVEIQTLVSLTAAITVTGITPGPSASGPPASAAAIAAVGVSLGVTATQIALLLE